MNVEAKLAESELASAISEIHELRKATEEAKASLIGFTERMLVGDRPDTAEACGADASPSFNGGLTGELRRAINGATDAAGAVANYARRLRQIG